MNKHPKHEPGMRIAIGSDHAGYPVKMVLTAWLEQQGYDFVDYGTDSTDPADYPDIMHPVADAVEKGQFDLGILICGSGQGASMTANKHPGIRAAICWMSEMASLARSHNDANVLCLPGRFIEKETAIEILRVFLGTPFSGGRHQRRIDKIPL
jgi:ribose 5-phosphate isomerase B